MDEDVRKRLEDLEMRVAKLEAVFQKEPKSAKKEISLKEFMLSLAPKTDVQKTLVVGYYLENHQGLLSFNIKDLEDGFRQAKEQLPSNMNQMVNENIRKGHFMESKEKKEGLKAWVLTQTGEKYVGNGLKED